jgi:hypothetical protein
MTELCRGCCGDLPPGIGRCLILAARYAHTRKTGASYVVVQTIIHNWDKLERSIQDRLKQEAENEATCNYEDWQLLINKK